MFPLSIGKGFKDDFLMSFENEEVKASQFSSKREWRRNLRLCIRLFRCIAQVNSPLNLYLWANSETKMASVVSVLPSIMITTGKRPASKSVSKS